MGKAKKIPCKDDNGIYGIYIIDDISNSEQLIYIGKTTSSFQDRHDSHLRKMMNNAYNGQPQLYNRMRYAKKMGYRVEMRPLIVLNEVKWHEKYITESELCMMELALIHTHKPPCNRQGIDMDYTFIHDGWQRDYWEEEEEKRQGDFGDEE